jgi:hypothetical protein
MKIDPPEAERMVVFASLIPFLFGKLSPLLTAETFVIKYKIERIP